MDYNFEEYKKGVESSKSLWAHFLRESKGQVAKCKTCSKVMKCAGGSTSALHTHLRTAHKTTAPKRGFEDCGGSGTNFSMQSPETYSPKKKITQYFLNKSDDSLAAAISRMTAKDGLAFSLFCTSEDLRSLLALKGFRDIPKSSNTIRKIVLNYGQNICNVIKNSLSDVKKQGFGFSLTFDEWTSISNRRYLNINIHTKQQFWGLGLTRIIGSFPAEKCIQVLKDKLTKFGICLSSDIVCITTDGASVMKKIGRLIDAEQQLCFAHGIQLAILSVLYRKDNSSSSNILNEVENTENDDTIDTYDDSDSDVDDDNLMMNTVNLADQINFAISNDEYFQQKLVREKLSPLIHKIRKVVKLFKNSPVKNDDYLQKYVVLEFGKEKYLILDSKTRWNSLLFMLERFYELRTCVQKSLIDLKSSYSFSDDEFKLLSETITVLLPMKLGVESLCRRDASLLTADATFNFMLSHLNKSSDQLAFDMKMELLRRIKERRTDLSSLLQYLHNKYLVLDYEKNSHSDVFCKLSKASIIKLVKIQERMSVKTMNENVLPGNDDISEVEDLPSQLGEEIYEPPTAHMMKYLLQKAIDQQLRLLPQKEDQNNTNLNAKVRQELIQFESNGVRGPELERVYNFLLSIPPTSVEAERAFSASGNICTKIRSRLADNTIDMLCLMRS